MDLSIPAGSNTAVIGPSGSGKSTLLRLLLGLVRAHAGTVRFEGSEVPGDDAPRAAAWATWSRGAGSSRT